MKQPLLRTAISVTSLLFGWACQRSSSESYAQYLLDSIAVDTLIQGKTSGFEYELKRLNAETTEFILVWKHDNDKITYTGPLWGDTLTCTLEYDLADHDPLTYIGKAWLSQPSGDLPGDASIDSFIEHFFNYIELHGPSKLKWGDKTFESTWTHSRPDNQGVFTWGSGDRFDGTFVDSAGASITPVSIKASRLPYFRLQDFEYGYGNGQYFNDEKKYLYSGTRQKGYTLAQVRENIPDSHVFPELRSIRAGKWFGDDCDPCLHLDKVFLFDAEKGSIKGSPPTIDLTVLFVRSRDSKYALERNHIQLLLSGLSPKAPEIFTEYDQEINAHFVYGPDSSLNSKMEDLDYDRSYVEVSALGQYLETPLLSKTKGVTDFKKELTPQFMDAVLVIVVIPGKIAFGKSRRIELTFVEMKGEFKLIDFQTLIATTRDKSL
ncbi:MAG: hypothetical protein SF053_00555 [Bacteroidia bacterium]|nr:hypothetical protein [Bacteroidia bacterium]